MQHPAKSLRRACVIGVTAIVLTSSAVLGATAAQGAPAAEGLKLTAVRESLLATHYWYEQTINGTPVLGGYYAKHVDRATNAVRVDDGRIAVPQVKVTGLRKATVSEEKADAAAAKATGGTAYQSRLVIVPGDAAKLAWQVNTDLPGGSISTLVDATSGVVISSKRLVKEATGTGKVFEPNPVAAQQNSDLRDEDPDEKFSYKLVHLRRLHAKNRLIGDYAANVSERPVVQTSGTYAFTRSDPRFAQVMGYYHINGAQEYLHALGFTDANNESQKYRTTGLTADNSYYDPGNDQITFGTGGVDDAEDAEVIWHEYGHAIHDAQVPNFGDSAEAGAIGEAFGDYWAYTLSQGVAANSAVAPWACIADWDAVSYTSEAPHCLRRTDGVKMYPQDIVGEVHADGEIWSRALMDINNTMGRASADRVIIEAQFGFAPDTSFLAAAQTTVATAAAMYGANAAETVAAAFRARGIL